MVLRVISFKADEDLLEKIDKISRKLNITRSEVIRTALEIYIKLERKNNILKEK